MGRKIRIEVESQNLPLLCSGQDLFPILKGEESDYNCLTCDDNYDAETILDFENTLHDIDMITESYPENDGVIVGGDWNTDLRRCAYAIPHCSKVSVMIGN